MGIDKPMVMSIREAATMMRVGVNTMYEFAAREDFKALIQVGRKKLIHRRKFEEWIEAQTR
ncbi:MAG: helix-turn-helix domain-containing protein [Defluviitaleaceae bacterium]|nr:helix-turn-helix domain-containing protein [Defluviitaleaceae bacterium]